MFRYRPLVILAAVFMSAAATAASAGGRPLFEPVTLPSTEVRHLASHANGVTYTLYIGLPARHEHGESHNTVFPVAFTRGVIALPVPG